MNPVSTTDMPLPWEEPAFTVACLQMLDEVLTGANEPSQQPIGERHPGMLAEASTLSQGLSRPTVVSSEWK